MADNALANVLANYEPTRETVYGPFGEKYDVEPAQLGPDPLAALLGLRFGFKGMPKPTGPWSAPERPPAQPSREWKQSGDDGMGQQIYETLLGRWRKPGQAVADPDSGSVLTSPLFWLGSGLGAYGSYKLWGLDKEPLPWESPQTRPDSYANRVATERAGRDATFDARQMDQALALQNRDIPAYNKIENPIFGDAPPYSEGAMNALARYRLPGGGGNAPY